MTTLYRPVLIETAEQAEALPEGTIWPHVDYFTGWTALVPIEAEEETTDQIQVWRGVAHIGPRSNTPAPSRRLVTPWEAS